MLESFHTFGDNGHVKINYHIMVYGGANYKSSPSNNDQLKAFQLDGSMKRCHQDQAGCA
jgi:hypothetical protein